MLGLDDRPQAAARYRAARPEASAVSYTPLQLAAAYDLPAGDGTGQTIAIIELGGGFGQSDLDTYFGGLGLATPSVTAVGVDGAANVAGQDPNGADGEVLLDIEVAGAIAPAARQLVYFAPNTDAGFLDAVTQAAHATPAPTAMSISWGQSEDQWSAQARTAMDSAFADAALLGVTVTAAAGDNGSADNQSGRRPHADFPAASPHVLGCGGTSLHLAADGTVAGETVWNDGGQGGATGGGVSDAFPVPDWQAHAGVPPRHGAGGKPGRGVPDVAAVADPQTGYQVVVDGQASVIGGTSAVAPLWAGLVCRLAQATGAPLGLLQPALYAGAAAGRAAAGLPRHHHGQQRRVLGRARLGRLHRARRARRAGAARGCAGRRVRLIRVGVERAAPARWLGGWGARPDACGLPACVLPKRADEPHGREPPVRRRSVIRVRRAQVIPRSGARPSWSRRTR